MENGVEPIEALREERRDGRMEMNDVSPREIHHRRQLTHEAVRVVPTLDQRGNVIPRPDGYATLSHRVHFQQSDTRMKQRSRFLSANVRDDDFVTARGKSVRELANDGRNGTHTAGSDGAAHCDFNDLHEVERSRGAVLVLATLKHTAFADRY
jgi:hypothetical protein